MIRLFPLLALVAFFGCVPGPLMRTAEMSRGISVDSLPPVPSFDLDALAEQYDQADAVYLRYWISDEHAFGLPRRQEWIYIQDRVSQYVVLDPEADWVTTTSFRVIADEVIIGYSARVTSPSGETRRFTDAALVSEPDGSARVYKLAFPSIERGSVVEQYYRTERNASPTVTPPLSEDYPLQFPAPVQSLRVRYIVPQEWGVQIKQIGPRNTPRYSNVVDTATGQRVYEFSRTDVPAYPDEPFSPFFRETAEYADLRVTRIDAGAAQYKPADSWRALGEEFSDYAYRKGGLFSSPVRSATREALSGDVLSDSLKLVQIVGWVQDNIEVEPASRDDLTRVVRERRGNPLLICGLTQAMLDEVDIDSEFLLIHPNSAGFFDEAYVSASQVSIPAVGATIDGVQYVVFPFIEGLPVNYIPPPFQGARAVRITADGFGGFVEVPSRDSDAYAVDEAFDILIDEDGNVRVEETKTLRGIAAYATRSSFSELDEEEREAEVRDLVTYTEGEITDLDYELVRLDDFGTPFEVRIRYTIDNAVTVTPEEVLFQTGGLLSPASLGSFKVDTRERQLPIRLYYDEVTNKSIRIRYPSTWSLSTALEDVDTSSRFGTVSGRYTMAPGEVVAQQSVRLVESEAPSSEYSELLRLTGTQSDLYIPTLVFEVVR